MMKPGFCMTTNEDQLMAGLRRSKELRISHQLTTISSSIFDNFLQGKWIHNHRRQKMLSKSSSNPEVQIFML